MSIEIGHEKLRVYGRALEHVSWMQLVLEKISAIVLDHWERAAESVVENIANGNSRRSRDDRNKYFDVAVGSALECAACLDICCCKEMITKEQMIEGKRILQPIVNMTMGLREADTPYIKEPRELYGTEDSKYFFAHESLDAYKGSLDLRYRAYLGHSSRFMPRRAGSKGACYRSAGRRRQADSLKSRPPCPRSA